MLDDAIVLSERDTDLGTFKFLCLKGTVMQEDPFGTLDYVGDCKECPTDPNGDLVCTYFNVNNRPSVEDDN